MDVKKSHFLSLVFVAGILVNSQLVFAENQNTRVQEASVSSPTYCINLLSYVALPNYVPPPPNQVIRDYRELRSLYSDSMTSIQAIWQRNRFEQGALFLNGADDRKLDFADYRRIEPLQDLSFASIRARRDYQEALLEFFTAADADLAKITRVAEAYEKRLNEKNRGSVITAFDLSGRQAIAMEYATEQLDRLEKLRGRFLESKGDVERFVRMYPALTPFVTDAVALGLPTLGLFRESALRQVQDIMAEQKKSYADALQLKINELNRSEEVWLRYRLQAGKKKTTASISGDWVASEGNKDKKVVAAWERAKALYERAYYFSEAQAISSRLSATILAGVATEITPEFAAMTDESKAFAMRKVAIESEDLLRRLSQATQWELVTPTPLWGSHKDGMAGQLYY